MQKGLAIIGLLCCAAGVCRAGDAPLARVNAVYTSAMGGCWGLFPREMMEVLRTAGGFAAQQKVKWCAAEQQMVRTTSLDGIQGPRVFWGLTPTRIGWDWGIES